MGIRIRRFEPAGGVSRHMIEAEAKYVAREAESYLRLSLNDLKEKLSRLGAQWNQADESLHAMVEGLPERDRLALLCMLVRDQMFLLELYLQFVRTHQPEGVAGIKPAVAPPKAPAPSAEPAPAPPQRAPHSGWLFDT